MPRESKAAMATRAQAVLDRLEGHDPDWTITLDHETVFQLLIATMCSAQSTDAMVNKITPALFDAYPTAEAMADAPIDDVEALIHSTGYFRQKAKHIVAASKRIVEAYGGEIPATMRELTTLPGVGRKTANVVLHTAYGVAAGVCVDTHVTRLANRLGFAKSKDAVRIEQDLMRILPPQDWQRVTHLLINHGRATCAARNARCHECKIADLCPSAGRPDRYL